MCNFRASFQERHVIVFTETWVISCQWSVQTRPSYALMALQSNAGLGFVGTLFPIEYWHYGKNSHKNIFQYAILLAVLGRAIHNGRPQN